MVNIQFSPSSSNMHTIRIRVVTNDDITNMHTEMLVRLLENQNVLQEKTFTNAEIVDGQFCNLTVAGLKPQSSYSLEIKSNQATGGFLLLTGENAAKETSQWAWDEHSESSGVEIAYIYNDINAKKFVIALAFLLMSIAWLLLPFEIKSAKLKLAYDLLVLSMASALMFYCIELLSFNSLSNIDSIYIISTVLFIFLINLSLYLVFSLCFIPVAITGSSLLIFGIINHYVVSYRNDVLVPSDIFAAFTAANVISSYKFSLSIEIVIASIIFIFLLSVSYNKRRAEKNIIKIALCALCGVTLFVSSIFVFINPKFYAKIDARVTFFEPRLGALQYGFLLNFAVLSTQLSYVQPLSFSLDTLQNAYPQAITTQASQAPNIIIIMNESLADLNDLGNIPINKDYLPFIHSLSEGKNSYVGRVVVPVFGGGTSNTEFEALTGFSFACSPSTQAPYLQFIRGKTPSIAQTLKNSNYVTNSLHLYNRKNWYRQAAYPSLGFDSSLFIEDFDISQLATYRENASDAANYDVILAEFEKARQSNTPFFDFSITIQNHGGYASLFDHNEIKINADGFTMVQQYLNLAHLSDQAFENFIGELKQISEPTIVVMFGDHYPYFPQDFYAFMENGQPENSGQISTYYKTPIIFWANFDIDTAHIPPLFSINYLQNVLLDVISMPKTPYQHFLSSCMEKMPVFSLKGFVDSNNNYYDTLVGTEHEPLFVEYANWQYAGLFESRKCEDLFFNINADT